MVPSHCLLHLLPSNCFGTTSSMASPSEKQQPQPTTAPGDQTDESSSSSITTSTTRRTIIPISFDGPHDPADPLNWPATKKLAMTLTIALLSAGGQLASSLPAPALPQLSTTFSPPAPLPVSILLLTIFPLGTAVGLLLTSSLSTTTGRAPLTHLTNALFVLFACLAAASTSRAQLLGFRFAQGFAAAAPPAIGGGVIGDLYLPRDRGRATSWYGLGLLLGPVVGPVVGGYVTQAAGWRWDCWVVAMVGAVNLVIGAVVVRETYRPLLLARKVERMQREAEPGVEFVSALRDETKDAGFTVSTVFRPVVLLLTCPVVLLPALIMAVLFGLLFLMLATLSTVYQTVYHFSIGASGLPYLGLGVGLLLGLAIYSATADRVYRRLQPQHRTPEARLAPISLGAPLAAAGLLLYGWALDRALHWVLPIIGCAVFALGLVAAMLPITTYLIDAFPHGQAAGPVGAATVLRSLAGGLLPLCAEQLYLGPLGYGWGCTVLALVALGFAPFPWLFYRKGEALRRRFPVQ